MPLIKDLFELLFETHYSRNFLKKNNLVSDIEKRMVRQALLQICALCGPDEETEPGSSFIDLNKL